MVHLFRKRFRNCVDGMYTLLEQSESGRLGIHIKTKSHSSSFYSDPPPTTFGDENMRIFCCRFPLLTMSVYGHLDQFCPGQDWGRYITVLKNYFGANEITSVEKQKQIPLSSVGFDMYELVSTLVVPDRPGSKKFDELVKITQDYVRPPPSKIVTKFKFYTLENGGEIYFKLCDEIAPSCQDCL